MIALFLVCLLTFLDTSCCLTRFGWCSPIRLPLDNLGFCIHSSNSGCTREFKVLELDMSHVSLVLQFEFPEDNCVVVLHEGLSVLLMKVGKSALLLLKLLWVDCSQYPDSSNPLMHGGNKKVTYT